MSVTVHLAPVVLTMTGPFLRDAAVVVEGATVTDVGPRDDVVRRHARARLREHAGVLTPGLVNAHAHLEYGPPFADLATAGLRFGEWLAELGRRRRTMDDRTWLEGARGSVHALLRSGTTAAADVVTVGPGLRAAAMADLAGISYVEALADDERWPAERARVERLLTAPPRTVGLSPHALYSLSSAVLRDCAALARAQGIRLHPHLAETADEVELVLIGTGRIADALTRLGWRLELLDGGAGASPVQHCADLGAVGPDVHVAHGVHVDAADRALLREHGTAVALCTRSNALLRAGEAPVAAYLAEGSPVALGTDSLASCPDLDLLAEARATRDLALRQGADPDGLGEQLVRAATVGGAAAMGLEGVGTLAPGVRADLAVFDVPTEGDPYDALVEHGAGRCTTTAVAGRLVHRR